jgi:flagellar hook-associated protein 1 FlgK
VLAAGISDPAALQASAYRLERQGATITLTRLSDGSQTDVSAALGGAPGSVTVDGVRLDLTAGSLADGDRFRIEPVQRAAADFAVVANRPEAVAAAGPVRARTPTDNAGNAAITPPEAESTQDLPLSGPITLTFDAANNEFDLSGGPGGSLAYDPASDAGGRAYSLSGYGDLRFEISGVPVDGDTFVLENNTGATGDGANALALARLRDERVFGGTTTLGGAFAEAVGDAGARTREAERAAEIQSIRLDAARGRREAVSGVNLDEEAANLVRFQQSYQASARVISVADNVFQTLLRATGA